MRYKTDERKWEAIKGYLDMAWKKPGRYPEGILLSLDDRELASLFTKERIRVIRLLRSSSQMTMGQLAKKLKRKLPAVERDLRHLEGMGIVDIRKKGRVTYPALAKEILLLPLIDVKRIGSLKRDNHIAGEA